MRIILTGNQNVGKSSLFSRLTSAKSEISNYPGTTVKVSKGFLKNGDEIMDVPGTYTVKGDSKAESIAGKAADDADLIVNVVDSTNLERNLLLTKELAEKGKPTIIALTFPDEAERKGIHIDSDKLEKELNVPVVKIVPPTGEGIKELVSNFDNRKRLKENLTTRDIETITSLVKTKEKHRKNFKDRFEELSVKPLPGAVIGILSLTTMFLFIVYTGEFLINNILDPLFSIYASSLEGLYQSLGEGPLRDILIGNLDDMETAMGVLTTGLYVPIVMVLPFVFSFYLILSLFEDTGYLPRLATMFDNIMHRVGLHGLAIVPMMLGVGCNVPGALATRILETKRQRFIAMTLISIAVPCVSQISMIYGYMGNYGVKALATVFFILLLVWILLGFFLNKLVKGRRPATFIEVPPYRMPNLKNLSKKLWIKMKGFFKEAVPYVILGVLIINLLYNSGIISYLGNILSPVLGGVFGLPNEAVTSLVSGFLRKDLAIGALIPLGLTVKQAIISTVVLSMYFPCIAMFVMMFKELGWKYMLQAIGIMIVSTFIVGGFLNLVL
ncbi:MAG: FeoB small GTPase domain-containing protein [Nanobdellota archaeon]